MKSSSENLSQEEIELQNNVYYSIELEKVFAGFSLCRTNTRKLFSAADAVSTGNPGLANSLMILCAEECVKGFVLFAVCANIPVPFLIKPIFSKHWEKHITGKELHNFVRGMSKVLGLFSSKRSVNAKSFLSLVGEIISVNDSKELNWWDRANDMKNNGLYVDYRGGKFQSPAFIGAETFIESKEIVGRFLTLIAKTESFDLEDFRGPRNKDEVKKHRSQ